MKTSPVKKSANAVTRNELVIREMVAADLDLIVRLEKEIFSAPFNRKTFENILDHENYYSWVVVKDGMTVGYAVCSLVVDDAELINIAVDKRWRSIGIGAHIMDYITEFLRPRGCRRMFLEVRPSNEVAKSFYEKFGFYRIGLRRGYYADNGEDAIVMVRKMG